MSERWQLDLQAWSSGSFRSALAPDARAGASPCAAAPFDPLPLLQPMKPHVDPPAGSEPPGSDGAIARALQYLGGAARGVAGFRWMRSSPPASGQPAGVQEMAAAALRDASRDVRRLSTLLISVQEDERRRIAFDLHDGIGQSLSLLKLSVEKSARLLRQGATREAEHALRELAPRIDDALAEVRRIAMELRPPMLEDLGLLPTLSWFFREFETAASDIVLVRTISVAEEDVPPPLHVPVFRILQEALHNVTKHADAARVHVRLERVGEALRLLIEDDGRGFDPESVPANDGHGRGLGLLSMRERATVSGASYRLHSAPGRGTTISVAWH